MRSYCCIPNCNSSSVDKEPGLSFHEFPTKAYFRTRWLKAVTTQVASDFQLDEKSKNKVCSKHFKESDFSPVCSKRRRLKGCAVPSVFPESKTINKVLELEIVIKKNLDESLSSCENEKLQNHSHITSVNRVFNEDENVSNVSSETAEEPSNCILELNDTENSSESLEVQLSSETHCKTADLNITAEHKTHDTEVKKQQLMSDVFINNAMDGLKKITAQESNLCEFTVFGLYVASQLQQMPLEEAYKLKKKIQDILTQSCPQSLKEPSFFSYSPQSSSERKIENPYCDLQSDLPFIKKSEKDKNSSSQHVTPSPVILQSLVLPSTALNFNSSYKICTL